MSLVPYIGPITLTANSTTGGIVSVPDTSIGFRKGAHATLTNSSSSQSAIIFDILSKTSLKVRLLPVVPSSSYVYSQGTQVAIDTPGVSPWDLSAYTTAASSTITQLDLDAGDAELGRALWLLDGKGQILPAAAPSINGLAAIGPIGWSVDFTNTNCITLATSTTDASISVPAGWYKMVISGQPAYINFNATAVTTGPLIPIGMSGESWYFGNSNGAAITMHAILAAGTGSVSLIPSAPKLIY